MDDAISAIREASRKGVAGKESTVLLSEAYYLYSANRFKEASEAASKGLALPGLTPDTSSKLKQIKDASDVAEAKTALFAYGMLALLAGVVDRLRQTTRG